MYNPIFKKSRIIVTATLCWYLHMTQIPFMENNSRALSSLYRCGFDGSMTCFIGAHLGLALLSLFTLLLLFLLIPALIIIAYHKKFSTKVRGGHTCFSILSRVLCYDWLSLQLRILDHGSLEKLSLSLTSPYHPHTVVAAIELPDGLFLSCQSFALDMW